ncbi:MAG: restriction endonuclease subunit S [Proteobacteria bacterium]|nr:MAG: restriction endonuclease subunit S [Pseudomonadota bacterium]
MLTLTEGRGFVSQRERFKKRLATEDTSNYKVVRKHDVAFNPYLLWAGAIAQNVDWDEAIISPAYPTFRIRKGFDPRYVDRLIGSGPMILAYDGISFGSVPRRRRSTVEDFLNLPVVVPKRQQEQKRIAAILDKADEIRRKRKKALRLTDDFLRSVFLDMFGAPESNGWTMTTVEGLALPEKGSMRTGPFGSQLLHSEFVDSGIAVLGIDNAVTNQFAWAKPRFITEEKYAELERYTVRPGDVLITIMGTCGRCAVVPDDIPTSINTKHLCCITLDHNKCLPDFLHAYFLLHPIARRYLALHSKGAIMDGLNMGIIKGLPVPEAPMTLQREFSRLVNKRSATTTRLFTQSDEADDLFDSLQQRAFRGEL